MTNPTRLVLRYRSHVLKIWCTADWSVEGRITPPKGKASNSCTSFMTGGRHAMLRYLKRSVDGWIKSEIEIPQYRRAHTSTRVKALTRKFKG